MHLCQLFAQRQGCGIQLPSPPRNRGFRIWYDEGIEPGASWYDVLAERIASAPCMLLFMSSHSQRSPYISKEITCVIAKRKHIVCVVLDGCEVQGAFELMLCDTQMMSRSDGAFYEKLEKALQPELTREGGADPVASSGSPALQSLSGLWFPPPVRAAGTAHAGALHAAPCAPSHGTSSLTRPPPLREKPRQA
ncbi:MAG: toll/interleukin-1 receptor domain-containing protein [Desulfovibrio sp.]|nr:toll/interleukin-1 receptor domain-containing protein [Desulfovibrio sp.]